MNRVKWLTVGEFSIKRLIRSMLLIPIFVYFGVFFILYFFSDNIIFQAQSPSYTDTDEIVKLDVGGGEKISAIHLRSQDSSYTILFSHGNAEDIGTTRETLERLRSMGFSVFSYDYRGYGTSSGKASESNSYQDADAAYSYLVDDLQIAPDKIIVLGRSLGGAVAVDLASRKAVGGLILENSFVTAFRVVTHVPLFPFEKFNNLAKIGNVRCPVLVIHGTKDEVIPTWHGERLFQEANVPKLSLWVDGAGHNNLVQTAGASYENKLAEFARFIESN